MKPEHKDKFVFVVANDNVREKLFCEISFNGELVAEINQETDRLRIVIFERRNKKPWDFDLEQFQDAIEYGRKHLLKGSNIYRV